MIGNELGAGKLEKGKEYAVKVLLSGHVIEVYLDGELCDFVEFVPQGEDSYVLYSLTDLALVKYADGHILSLTHAHRISEAPLGAFPFRSSSSALENS